MVLGVHAFGVGVHAFGVDVHMLNEIREIRK